MIFRTSPVIVQWIAALASTLFFSPLAGQRSAPSMYDIRTEYDAARGKTILHLGRTVVDSVTELSALAVFNGRRTAGQPQNDVVIVTLLLRESESTRTGNTVEAVIFADSDDPGWTGLAYLRPPSDGFAETLFLAIPFPVFRKLAKAECVAIALDGHSIRLTPQANAAIREYVRRMTFTEPE